MKSVRVLGVVFLALWAVTAFAAAPLPDHSLSHHHFHADAIAVATTDDHAVASVSLSPLGGEETATVEHYDSNGIRFDEAKSVVSGHKEGDVNVTVSTTTIRNLSIYDVIRADAVVTRVTNRHRLEDEEGEITFDGSSITNLTVNGRPVEVTLDPELFSQFPTYATFTAQLPQHRRLFAQAAARFGWQTDYAVPTQSLGVVTGSLATAVRSPFGPVDGSDVDGLPYSFKVPGFGTVYVGKVEIKPGTRRLTMLSWDQDSVPIKRGSGGGKGSGTVSSASTNGTELIP